MKDRPVIMTAESVRAIIAGKKTQTRRLIEMCEFGPSDMYGYDWTFRDRRGLWNYYTTKQLLESKWCRFAVGTRLWVKEGCAIREDIDPAADLSKTMHYLVYRADREHDDSLSDEWHSYGPGWRSPLFMPRWASRLTLEVTEVRVQRLQEITEDDARAEGCRGVRGAIGQMIPGPPTTAREHYQDRWDHINGKRVAWVSNPWVWAVTFRRLP